MLNVLKICGKIVTGSLQNKMVNGVENIYSYLVESGIDKIKQYFGKEYYFNDKNNEEINNTSVMSAIYTEFIKKYDKTYEKKKVNVNGVMGYKNSRSIIMLEKGTFLYLATGRYSTSALESEFLAGKVINDLDTYMYIFGKKMRKYVKELNDLIVSLYTTAKTDDLGFYTVSAGESKGDGSKLTDISYQPLAGRSMNTLFFSNKEDEKIIEFIDHFNTLENLYKERQLLYKTGILVYGIPGVGKSSLIKALATKYKRHVLNINVAELSKIDLSYVTKCINNDVLKFIILFEDIDTLFLNRDKEEANRDDRGIINSLLNFLDSNSSPNNVIFIATTNYPERLDDALLREGRFDMKLELHPLKAKDVITFGKTFGLTEEQCNEIIDTLADEMKLNEHDKYNKNVYRQATVQTHILSKISNKSLEKAKELFEEEPEDAKEQEDTKQATLEIDDQIGFDVLAHMQNVIQNAIDQDGTTAQGYFGN